jgi:hypothetical protein
MAGGRGGHRRKGVLHGARRDRGATQHTTATHFQTASGGSKLSLLLYFLNDTQVYEPSVRARLGTVLLNTRVRACRASKWRACVEDIEGKACFMAPDEIKTQRSHGAAIAVGCVGGALCILHAPFVAV